MRNYTTNAINLCILSIFIVAPFVGYISQTYLGKGFNTISIPLLLLGAALLLFFRKELSYSKPLIFLTIFALYTIVSDAVLTSKEYTLSYFISNEALASVLVLFIIENTKFTDKYIKKVYTVSAIVLIIAFIVSIIQEFVNLYFFVNPLEAGNLRFLPAWETRLPSIYSWIGPLAVIGLCFFPVLALVIDHQLKHKSNYIWLFYFIGAIVAFLTKSRFIMVNYIMLLFLIPIYRKVKFISVVKFIMIIIVSTSAFLIIVKQFNFKVGDIVEKRILESDKGGMTHGAASTRLLAFDIFGQLFTENIVFGKGKLHDFGGKSKDYELVRALSGRSSQIHVGYLSLFYYYGLIGGGLFLSFICFMIMSLYKSAKIHHHWGPLFGFAQFLLSNGTGVWLHVYFMGFILCFMFDKYYTLNHENLIKQDGF